ncbi:MULTISPECIES: diguanylate cyclase [unclassified Nostoc]|uniref:GGDEF domain-containing protein n=1 Tax=unclassified Nostoc TaxID=2593658 RepID=UPI000DEC8F74|nr:MULTISPECIES: diguanylate cyclase [unclassified Nostoc]MBD2506906.1 diguanylate cyclase [Desmonostoc muscorum FACHB-395]QHG19037.1 diguanylate cyclase [Nostoc sp. ATCC 53789]QLE47392.1 diguanylate cyclase [Nostoc sp. C057]RCJ18848.1 diguanylate cyclase [Nostoc sp. ATCC 53789]
MNISILVFGKNNFIATLPDQIRYAAAFSVEVIDNLNQAVSRIKIAPPDIILVQASLDGSMELCNWLKEQTKLSWIYCILFEDRFQQLIDRNKGWHRELEMSAAALKQGADAYIWHLIDEKTDHNLAELTANHGLILAQLTVGLRKAQKYRDLIRTNDMLSAIALADSLTELNNRRALEWDLPRQIQRARTQKTSLSLIILDVDHFKKVNDTHGHLVGDRILQILCQRLRHNLRCQDTAFRYGGEEFVILLANTTDEEAILVARRLNRIVSDEPFALNNKLTINITISLGTASLQADDDEKGESLLNRADQCLLQAKNAGRNRVMHSNHLSHVSHLKVVSS